MTPRPINILRQYHDTYPGAWKVIARMRASRGQPGAVPTWSDWCYAPMAAAYAVVSGGGPNRVPFERSADIGAVAALAAWRITKGVYRIDQAVLGSLWEQPIDEAVRAEDLTGLPEWCLYLDLGTSGVTSTLGAETGLRGAFIHMEEDARNHHAELRLLLDFGEGHPFLAVPLDLGGTLQDGFRSMSTEALRVASSQAQFVNVPMVPLGSGAAFAEAVRPLVSVAAYLASSLAVFQEATDDWTPTGSARQPSNPKPVGKKGRIPAHQSVTHWLVS